MDEVLSKENGRAPQSSFDFATILVVRRKMDPHARSFSFVRERARTNPIPDDLVVSDSDLESIGNLDTTTKLVASRSHGRPRKGPVKQTSTKGSIIELSDDSSRQPSIPGIIELSDDSDSQDGPISALPLSIPRQRLAQALPTLPLNVKPTNVIEIFTSGDEDSDSETPSLNLSLYAYSSKSTQSRPRMASSSIKSVRTNPPLKPLSTRMIHSATDFLTDHEVDRLNRCVACGIAWTTTKAVSKKRYHLRICQKKNDLTDDTIHILIEKELSKVAEADADKGKGKGSAKSITLMDDVLHDAQPKKRGKRKELRPTIISIQHQHETIQQRAKRLFDMDSDGDDGSTLEISTTTSTNLPLTQEFPTSKFGGNKIFQTDLTTSLPSPTPSDDEEKLISISSDSTSSALGSASPHFSQGSERHPLPRSVLRQSLALYNGENEWMEDLQREIDTRENVDQWLETNMLDHSNGGRVGEKDTVSVHSVEKTKKRGRPPIPTSKLASNSGTLHSFIPQASFPAISPIEVNNIGKRGGATSPSKTNILLQGVQDQENFNNIMQERIKEDAELWHRVLRYEPVPFTEFLDMALATGAPKKNLTEKLRTFLISRAVHVSMPRVQKRR